ncbi:trans-sulfuration enzyme family protein [Bacillus taeanensis]|uniref:homocysteine desulfhydrase n=1 Tax=Bacillus taeanensis TaxID=273032 RepID=A0A366XPB5_9BACI|nr:aminotransferase class I/II-fold pyridoxal phosphate-dependent enzyme [Bacillus taeanensis]RBW67576.1 cystathionine gamma-synthase [Bacillus taeanensis]
MKFDTKTVQFQQKMDAANVSKGQPIYQTTAFAFKDLDDLEDFFRGKKDFLYTRVGNPNTDDLAAGVAQLEGAPKGVATSSGLSAVLAAVLSFAKHGDHIVACEDLYGGTYQLMAHELASFGIEVSFVDFTDLNEVEKAIQSNTKALYSESVTNPLLRVENIEGIVSLAKKHELISVIDNTFATPYFIRPYELGVDIVLHSATKYIGGHSDVTAGVVVGREEYMEQAKNKVVNLGANLSPFEAWLACRGLRTLSIRMERHAKNAQRLAEVLQGEVGVKKVYYPSTVSEKGNGAIVSMELDETCDVNEFFKSLGWVKMVATLAGVDTSVSYPIATSHRQVPEETRQKLAITPGLVRISVGIEDSGDIISALKQAVKASLR